MRCTRQVWVMCVLGPQSEEKRMRGMGLNPTSRLRESRLIRRERLIIMPSEHLLKTVIPQEIPFVVKVQFARMNEGSLIAVLGEYISDPKDTNVRAGTRSRYPFVLRIKRAEKCGHSSGGIGLSRVDLIENNAMLSKLQHFGSIIVGRIV